MGNHDTLTKTTLLICKANVKRWGLSTRGRERKLRAFYRGDAGKHPMFCFAFRQRVRKRDWIGLLSAGSPVIYSMVILAHPLHSLSLSPYHLTTTTPAHLSLTFSRSHTHTHLLYLSFPVPSLSVVQRCKDDKVIRWGVNFLTRTFRIPFNYPHLLVNLQTGWRPWKQRWQTFVVVFRMKNSVLSQSALASVLLFLSQIFCQTLSLQCPQVSLNS